MEHTDTAETVLSLIWNDTAFQAAVQEDIREHRPKTIPELSGRIRDACHTIELEYRIQPYTLSGPDWRYIIDELTARYYSLIGCSHLMAAKPGDEG